MSPFPFHLWLVALRDTLRWILAYEPPPGPAESGQVNVSIHPVTSEKDDPNG